MLCEISETDLHWFLSKCSMATRSISELSSALYNNVSATSEITQASSSTQVHALMLQV